MRVKSEDSREEARGGVGRGEKRMSKDGSEENRGKV